MKTSEHSRKRIYQLSDHLIDQIKAGEVIERPANVLKELMENALDAMASEVHVHLAGHGLELISVKDNGHGILFDDLATAFGRHATSKIQSYEDLYRLHSFGFRGEALPSIAAVSNFSCVSFTDEEEQGGEIKYEGGKITLHHRLQKSGLKRGTEMTVRNLFFNTPARLRFIQTQATEKNWLKRFFLAFVISHPEVTFSLQWDGGEKEIYPACDSGDFVTRITQLYPIKANIQEYVQTVSREYREIKLRLIVAPATPRCPQKWQHVLVNGRPLIDRGLANLLQQSLDVIYPEATPYYLLLLDLPGDEVDVNVHPNKTVVKFHQWSTVASLVTASVRELHRPIHAAHPASSIQAQQTAPLEASTDLGRNREQNYRGHMQAMHGEIPNTSTTKLLWSWNNGQALFAIEEQEHPLLVNFEVLLKVWAQEELKTVREAIPLLVAFPLQNQTISDSQKLWWKERGVEIDHTIIRTIPHWMKGMPLRMALSAAGLLTGQETAQADQLSPGKWEEILQTLGLPRLLEENLACWVTPQMLTSK